MSNVSINMAAPSGASAGGAAGSSNTGESGRIQQLMKQIEGLQKQLKDLADSSLSPEDKKMMQQLLLDQIKLLQAEIDRIRQQELQEQKQPQEPMALEKGDGINRPTQDNRVDLYI